jgi:hypothetical protein
MVTWQHHQRSFVWCGIKDFQSLFGLSRERLKLLDPLAESKILGAPIPITQNHTQLVTQGWGYVKRNHPVD